jgi:hypothetical protein
VDAYESKELGEGGGFHVQRKSGEKVILQRKLTLYDDEIREYSERMDGELFDREDRLAMLENQRCNPAPNSIFGAIFQEPKNRAKHEKYGRVIWTLSKCTCFERHLNA